jgi:AcrR family transcriptional regulator
MRRGPGTGRKEQVMATAIKLFAEKGFHATSVRDITSKVGMSKAGLYSSFQSKEAILEEIYYLVIGEMLNDLEKIAATENSPAKKLQAAMTSQIKGVAQRVPELTIFYREWHHLPPDSAGRITQKRSAYEKLLQAIIREGIDAGDFTAVDVPVMAYGILGMCAWTYQWYRPDGRLSPDEIGEIYADLVIGGLSKA